MHSEYNDPEKKRTSWFRIGAIIIGVILILVIIFFVTKGCVSVDLYTPLVTATKQYLNDEESGGYPVSVGDCMVATLSQLENKGLINNANSYAKYDIDKTYVKVCKLESGNFQYTPVLNGEKKSTVFDEWEVGKEEDLIQNSSDVDFKFFGEVAEIGTKNYYPDNNSITDKVSQYYIDIPAQEYTYKDSPEVAYKWYIQKQNKEYYNGGAYSSIQPNGYTNKDSETTKSYLTPTNPGSATYRISNQVTLYSTEMDAYPYLYVCIDKNKSGSITSNIICENRSQSDFKKTSKLLYTCDGKNEVAQNTVCSKRTDWTTTSCKSSSQTKNGTTNDGYNFTQQVSNGKKCVSTSGYSVTDTMWKWYKNVDIKSYYPSGSVDSSKENTYYVNTPTAGAVKDEETKVTAYKYYKLVQIEGDNVVSWVSISDSAMSSIDLINKYKEMGYDINSLQDIESNEMIRYQIELSYRKRK